MVNVRMRFVAATLAVSTTVLTGASLLITSPAIAAAPTTQVGLFGSQDPTYDGAFRQSLGLLAYVAADLTPPTDAVDWLVGQQCADGGFEAFRADTSQVCAPSDAVNYSGEDTNSTGMAAVALRALGKTAAADDAVAWLMAAQNVDGGFPYFVKGDSDANSTAVVLFATNAKHQLPSAVQRGGVSAADFLTSLQIGCDGAATEADGAFAFQDYGSGLVANDAASVQATLALSGASLPLAPASVSTDVPRATCPAPVPQTDTSSPVELAAGHVARLLDAFGGAVPQVDYSSGDRVPGSVSVGDTAWAVLSLAAVGVGRTQLDAALATLAKSAEVSVSPARLKSASASSDQPGLLGVVALAIRAAGGSPDSVGAAATRVGATMRTAPTSDSPSPSSSPSASDTEWPDDIAYSSGLPPTGSSSITPVLGGAGGLLVLLGLLTVVVSRRRGTHA